jgi:1-acyl-sn-glycerol-3-phosphate acyltransferase
MAWVRAARPIRYGIGAARMVLMTWILVLCSVVVITLAVLPLRFRGIRLSHWMTTFTARALLLVLNIRTACRDAYRLHRHQGFVFPNHMSYVDILVMLHVMPVRFISTHWVRYAPFVGWMAMAIETIFVNRGDRASRQQVRQQLAETLARRRFPPLVIFVEGGIGPRFAVGPFRFGAFEAAVEGQIPFLTCAIAYDRPEHVAWYSGNILKALWQLAIRQGPILAHVFLLEVTQPQRGDSAAELAAGARAAVAAMLAARSPAMVAQQAGEV